MSQLCAAVALDLVQTLLGSAEGSDESALGTANDGHAARFGVVMWR